MEKRACNIHIKWEERLKPSRRVVREERTKKQEEKWRK